LPMASRRSAVVSGEEQLPRTQPPNGLIHLVIRCCKRELWQAAAGVWACALGGESASASVVGPGTGSGWHCDGKHAATPATPAMPATPATPGYIKNGGPATLTAPSPGPVFTSSRFSLLPPGTTSFALCAHHITHSRRSPVVIHPHPCHAAISQKRCFCARAVLLLVLLLLLATYLAGPGPGPGRERVAVCVCVSSVCLCSCACYTNPKSQPN
jgi:hypothetical protein